MGREKSGFRDMVEDLNARFPNRAMINIKDVCQYTGWSRNTIRKYITFNERMGGVISKVDLARQLCV